MKETINMSDTKQISFVADQETIDIINELKKELRATTTAAVFRKSLAIAKMASDQAKDSGGIVSIRGKSQPQESEVSIALRM
jgi:hypothetical protein